MSEDATSKDEKTMSGIESPDEVDVERVDDVSSEKSPSKLSGPAKTFCAAVFNIMYQLLLDEMALPLVEKYSEQEGGHHVVLATIKSSIYMRFMNKLGKSLLEDDTSEGRYIKAMFMKMKLDKPKPKGMKLEEFIGEEKPRKVVRKWFDSEIEKIRPVIEAEMSEKDFVQSALEKEKRKRDREERKAEPKKKKKVVPESEDESEADLPCSKKSKATTNGGGDTSSAILRDEVGYKAARSFCKKYPRNLHPDVYIMMRTIKGFEGDSVKVSAFLSNLERMSEMSS
jgi:hypothetical protein